MASRFDSDEMRPTPPQTEDSKERGFVDEMRDDLGEPAAADLDADETGDIADETPGHRG